MKLLAAGLILAFSYAVYSQTVITKQAKQIRSLQSDMDDLEKEKKELAQRVQELEDGLSNVKHFDNDATVRQGYSSGDSGGMSFTGSVYEGTIDGEFEGWDGETIFKMMDGSIWQQASYDYTYHYAYMPRVIIFNKDGATYMKVEDVEDIIQVRRLK